MASMVEAVLWLTPAAQDLLKNVSDTQCGALPCPAATLAGAVEKAEKCEGLLSSASLRKAFAAEIKALNCEVSDSKAGNVVDALGKVLVKDIDAIKKQAATVKGKVPKQKTGEPMPGYKAMKEATKDSQALSKDWLVWHNAANAWASKEVSSPPEAVVADRAALAACCPDGPISEYVIALHVLENLAAYVKWELSLAGSQPVKACIEVKCPFDSKLANEVALRRTLTLVLAPEMAMKVIHEAGGDVAKVAKALEKLAAAAKKTAVFPMYTAPPAPKAPKGAKDAGDAAPKEKKGKKGEGEAPAAKPVAAAAGAAKPVAVAAGDAGAFNALHAATATQELQWHLLAYRLDPGTTLSRTSTAATQAGKSSPKGGASAAKGQAAPATSKPLPTGFPAVWGVATGILPPGHTEESWTSMGKKGSENFQDIWSQGVALPPGHTEGSWGNATSSAPAGSGKKAAAPKSPKQAAAAAPAAKKSPKASPKAAPAAAPAAASGPVDEAAIKAVGDKIRELKEKLKGEGVTGKKLNDHPDITAAVQELAALKAGGGAPTPAKTEDKKKEAAPKKGGKKEKEDTEVVLTPEQIAEEKKKQMKKVIKEGGKRGVEIEGAADMGGLQFFCTSVDEPRGDIEMLDRCMEAMNEKSDPTEEERKGGSGAIGKMIFSCATEHLAICAYVPEAKQGECSCEEWLKAVLANFGGVMVKTGKSVCIGKVLADGDKNIFPLKIREPMILEANNFLRKRGLFPEDNGSDSDEMVFGDDDFPSM